MSQEILTVQGMSCQHCVKSIEGALRNKGVSGVVDLASKTVKVEYDQSKTNLEEIKQTIEDSGYTVL